LLKNGARREFSRKAVAKVRQIFEFLRFLADFFSENFLDNIKMQQRLKKVLQKFRTLLKI